MPISKPTLPPKAGYVEVIDSDGNHVYRPTSETTQRLETLTKQTESNNNLWSTFKTLLAFEEFQQLLQAAEQFRKALQIFAGTLTEEQALEVATIYPQWQAGVAYKTGEIVSYGVNSTGDPQLYKIVQDHTSQADWLPDATASLYDAFGLDESGYPVWSQPTGAHDAYNTGDIVNYNGTLYQSTIDGNVWSPDAYPTGWTVYTPEA